MDIDDASPAVVVLDDEDDNNSRSNKLDDSLVNLDIDDDQWFSNLTAEEMEHQHHKNKPKRLLRCD